MDERPKAGPGGTPTAAGELEQSIREGIRDPARSAGIRIRMTIDGGLADERYRFDFEASGDGALRYDMLCRLTGRESRARTAAISRDEFAGLLADSDGARLDALRALPARIPPCSLLGRLELWSGTQWLSVVFMADPEQAKQAGAVPPPGLSRLIDHIFELSERHSEAGSARSLRP